MSEVADRVKGVAVEEAEHIRSLATAAARSGAYLYPIRGIIYFVSHKALWKPLGAKLVPSLTLGLGVTVGMFVLTYVPQMAVMAFTQGPLAAVSAAILVLSESSALFTILSKTFMIEDALTDTFDGTLVSKNVTNLVSSGRQIKAGGDPIAKLGKLIKKPFERFAPNAIIRYLMYLPLNFIPVMGTIMFVLLQGRRMGPQLHSRYFQLKGWNSSQRQKHIEENKAAYASFGVVAALLEMVPIASILFAFTNTVGAALWAADMEKGEADVHVNVDVDMDMDGHGTSPELRQMAKKAD